MAIIETKLGPIGADIAGSGGIPVMFLHGVGSDRSAWAPQLAALAGERMAIAIDLPGYGDSAFLPGATRQTFAGATLAVLDALDIEAAHICGLSLGGVVALALYGQAPERCASLILADSFACHPEGQAILDRSLAGVAAIGMAGLAETRADALLAAPADSAVKAAVIAVMARLDPAAYALAAEAVWLADQRRIAAAVTCPTLIVYGSEDRITPSSLSEELKSLILRAGLIEIAGAGHLSNLEKPAVFNRILTGFLLEAEDKA